jgi:hypothetical protein
MSIIYLVYTGITFTSGIILRYQNLAADILFLVMGSVLLVCDLLSEPFYVSRVTGTDVPLAPWGCLVPGLFLAVLRYRQYNSSYLFARGDKQVYDSVWEDVLCTEAAALETLRLTAHKINIHTCKERPIQQVQVPVTEGTNHTKFMRASDIFTLDVEITSATPRETFLGRVKAGWDSFGSKGRLKETWDSFGSKGRLKETSFFSSRAIGAIGARQLVRVQSLDQLFAQATGMYMILRKNVQKWALHSGGCFQLEGDSDADFVSWVDVYNQPDMVAKIKWAKLKNLPRTVYKLLGAYGGDVSRLLDVCRERIIFNRVQDLLKCLEVMLRDEDVRIVRFKNRLDPAYNAIRTVGYRYLTFLKSSRMLQAFASLRHCSCVTCARHGSLHKCFSCLDLNVHACFCICSSASLCT